MKTFLTLAAVAALAASPALAARSAKGKTAEVMVYGDRVAFFFSMKETTKPPFSDENVVWQRWQLGCKKDGQCTRLVFYKLMDSGAGTPCSIDQDNHSIARFETERFDMAAGEVAVKVSDLIGTGVLKIRFDPEAFKISSAEVDFVSKGDPEEGDPDETRSFRLPVKSAVVRPACVFVTEGAEPLAAL